MKDSAVKTNKDSIPAQQPRSSVYRMVGCEGYLRKKSVVMYWDKKDKSNNTHTLVPKISKYHTRYFFIDQGKLYYAKTHDEKDMGGKIKVLVSGEDIVSVEKRESMQFEIVCGGTEKNFFFKTSSNDELNKWIRGISTLIPKPNPTPNPNPTPIPSTKTELRVDFDKLHSDFNPFASNTSTNSTSDSSTTSTTTISSNSNHTTDTPQQESAPTKTKQAEGDKENKIDRNNDQLQQDQSQSEHRSKLKSHPPPRIEIPEATSSVVPEIETDPKSRPLHSQSLRSRPQVVRSPSQRRSREEMESPSQLSSSSVSVQSRSPHSRSPHSNSPTPPQTRSPTLSRNTRSSSLKKSGGSGIGLTPVTTNMQQLNWDDWDAEDSPEKKSTRSSWDDNERLPTTTSNPPNKFTKVSTPTIPTTPTIEQQDTAIRKSNNSSSSTSSGLNWDDWDDE